MKVVAFLQNQWFKNPEKVAAIYAKYKSGGRVSREQLNARFLFAGSLTGKRLRSAFGDACDSIIWEEASRQVAGKSNGAFPADAQHIAETIERHQPFAILGFGNIACNGIAKSLRSIPPKYPGSREIELIFGPHPAARGIYVVSELGEMAKLLNAKLELHEGRVA